MLQLTWRQVRDPPYSRKPPTRLDSVKASDRLVFSALSQAKNRCALLLINGSCEASMQQRRSRASGKPPNCQSRGHAPSWEPA